jgi:hypothetical protein
MEVSKPRLTGVEVVMEWFLAYSPILLYYNSTSNGIWDSRELSKGRKGR